MNIIRIFKSFQRKINDIYYYIYIYYIIIYIFKIFKKFLIIFLVNDYVK